MGIYEDYKKNAVQSITYQIEHVITIVIPR